MTGCASARSPQSVRAGRRCGGRVSAAPRLQVSAPRPVGRGEAPEVGAARRSRDGQATMSRWLQVAVSGCRLGPGSIRVNRGIRVIQVGSCLSIAAAHAACYSLRPLPGRLRLSARSAQAVCRAGNLGWRYKANVPPGMSGAWSAAPARGPTSESARSGAAERRTL